jgi:sugar (pentulose or hexulose) kinase
MRTHLFSALGSLKIGMDILMDGEQVRVSGISGHGGFFKVRGVGQTVMASALGLPVTVMETAGEGGPWGMAILAAYMAKRLPGETLEAYLKNKVFSGSVATTAGPEPSLGAEFEAFMKRYKKGLAVERAAVDAL